MELLAIPYEIKIYNKKNLQDYMTKFINITHNLERTLTRLFTDNPLDWKEQLDEISSQANALRGLHNEHTKEDFLSLVEILKKCQYTGPEKTNFFAGIQRGLREFVKIMSYSAHPHRGEKKRRDMTRKLDALEKKNEIVMGLSFSSITIRQIISNLTRTLKYSINIIRAEE